MSKKSTNQVDFYKTKYGASLLIDLIRLESLEKYINKDFAHYLTYFDITIISGGQGKFILDHEQFQIEEGDVFFSVPGQIRKWEFESVPNGYVLIFEEEFLNNFLLDKEFLTKLTYFRNNTDTSALKLDKPDLEKISGILLQIEQEVLGFKTNDKKLLRALLYQILILFDRKYNECHKINNKAVKNQHIEQFIELVSEAYTNDHRVSFYADKLCISSSHLNDLSKSFLKMSAKRFIMKKVLLEAKRMLSHSDLPVIDISEQLGFRDHSYFIRLFRKETGVTPLVYRKEEHP